MTFRADQLRESERDLATAASKIEAERTRPNSHEIEKVASVRPTRTRQHQQPFVPLAPSTDHVPLHRPSIRPRRSSPLEVLHAAGRHDQAATVFSQALERYERKGNVAQADQVRDRQVALRDADGSRRLDGARPANLKSSQPAEGSLPHTGPGQGGQSRPWMTASEDRVEPDHQAGQHVLSVQAWRVLWQRARRPVFRSTGQEAALAQPVCLSQIGSMGLSI